MAVRHLTDLNPDGTNFGQAATEKLGFFGKAPIVRATVNKTTTTTATTTALQTDIDAIRTALKNLGLLT